MLAEAFAALERERVLPCPTAHPYVRVGRDYYGPDVMSGLRFRQFEQTLERTFRGKFGKPESGSFPEEFPNQYAFALLEACIARLGLNAEPYAATSTTVEQVIVELLDRLDSESTEVACVRMVGHLMTADGKELELGPVTVLPRGHWNDLGQIAAIIPTAGSAFNRELPHHFARPEALVAARASGPDPFKLVDQARQPVNRFLLAVRLLHSSTSTGIYEVTGETAEICRYGADLAILEHANYPMFVRPAVLSAQSRASIASVLELRDQINLRTATEVVHPLEMALLKFSGTFSARGWFEDIVDLTTALEASLSGTSATDISLRVCSRAAALLATDTDNPSDIFGDLHKLYELRSRLVHGSSVSRKDMDRWLMGLSVARDTAKPAMRVAIAVDRLRDLVRRAILARLILGSDQRWPFRGDLPPIDQILADSKKSNEWRETWQGGLSGIGAADAVGPPAPLADSVFDSYPGKD
jgi:Apea-like HEPN